MFAEPSCNFKPGTSTNNQCRHGPASGLLVSGAVGSTNITVYNLSGSAAKYCKYGIFAVSFIESLGTLEIDTESYFASSFSKSQYIADAQ